MLRVVGAGVGRTGTASLKAALERLLGGPCYHMAEVFEHTDHIPLWHAALLGEQVDWDKIMDGYVAVVDWPAAGCWRDLAAAHPDALVLLSTRADAQTWWKSASATIMAPPPENEEPPDPSMAAFGAMVQDMFKAFEPRWQEPEMAMAAYDRHNAAVRREVPAERLVEWQPGDGWDPLAKALGVPVPDEPFPHTNTTDEFRERRGLDGDAT
jgi:Sulfotransferase domain